MVEMNDHESEEHRQEQQDQERVEQGETQALVHGVLHYVTYYHYVPFPYGKPCTSRRPVDANEEKR